MGKPLSYLENEPVYVVLAKFAHCFLVLIQTLGQVVLRRGDAQ